MEPAPSAAIIFVSIANLKQPARASLLSLPWNLTQRAPAEVTANYAIPVFASIEDLLAANLQVDAATVAVPTQHHHAVASVLLEGGLDLLVEKPIAATLAQADELLVLAEKYNRILQPGHLERFNPAVLAVQPHLRRPMFFEAHRLSVFTPRSLDVDVVLDLMIHDLDIVLTMANSPVREVRAVGLPILSPKVDIANVRVEFESGCVANFTASRVSTERVRKLRFFQPRSYVSIDYARQDLLAIRLDASITPEIAAAIAGGRVDPAVMAQLAAASNAGVCSQPQPRAVVPQAAGHARRAAAPRNPVVPRIGPHSPGTAGHGTPGPQRPRPRARNSIDHGRPRPARRPAGFLRANGVAPERIAISLKKMHFTTAS